MPKISSLEPGDTRGKSAPTGRGHAPTDRAGGHHTGGRAAVRCAAKTGAARPARIALTAGLAALVAYGGTDLAPRSAVADPDRTGPGTRSDATTEDATAKEGATEDGAAAEADAEARRDAAALRNLINDFYRAPDRGAAYRSALERLATLDLRRLVETGAASFGLDGSPPEPGQGGHEQGGHEQDGQEQEGDERAAGRDADALADLRALDRQQRRLHALRLLATFYAHLVHMQPTVAEPLARAAIASDRRDPAMIGAMALALSGTETGRAAIDTVAATRILEPETIARIRRADTYPFSRLPTETLFDLDVFWVSFFATGDPIYIDKVARGLDPFATIEGDAAGSGGGGPAADPEDAQEVARPAALAIAARWSLMDIAPHHPAVIDALQVIAAARDDRIGAAVASVLTDLGVPTPD